MAWNFDKSNRPFVKGVLWQIPDYRKKNNGGYLRRAFASWRRSVFRKRPVQSGQVRGLYVPVCAKNIVANELAKNCLVSVAYAIGRAEL